jgi:hypothetical protein
MQDNNEPPRFRPVPWSGLETPADVELWIEEHNLSLQENIAKNETGYGVCFTLAEGGEIYMQTTQDGHLVLDVTPEAAWGADLLDTAKARGTLRIAMEGTYPPFNFKDQKTGQLAGYDVDVARLLAAKLGLKPEFVSTEWAAILAGLAPASTTSSSARSASRPSASKPSISPSPTPIRARS